MSDETTDPTPDATPDGTGVSLTGNFVDFLGLELTETTGDRVVARWAVRPDLHQPFGILHGGVHCSVVETLASIGGSLWFGDQGHVVGVSNTTDFLRSTRDGALTSTATPVHRGRSQQLWQVETVDDDGRLVAHGQVRLHNLGA